jgi:signal transduction histidine kinase
MMEIHLYALCWNDADMLPFFFRHYDPLVSRYFIFDDYSRDGSLDLLHRHPNVEVQPFVRSDPDSFTLSELSVSDECWKRSRGCADWVIVIDIDEHLFHPDLPALLRRYKALGITIVPALGYQMISEEFPRSDELLCETRTQGAPWDIYSKLTFFDPAAITETNYGAGRHGASPTGRVIAPARDELLLLHYKFLGFERTHLRHQWLHSGLRSKDIENGWGYQYGWSEEEFRHTWREFAGNAIDVRTDAAIANYPGPPWWDPFRSLATQPLAQNTALAQLGDLRPSSRLPSSHATCDNSRPKGGPACCKIARAGQLSGFGELMQQWPGSVALAIAVGIAYFLASRLSLLLITTPDDVAVFWPAAGVAAGVLIALGPGTRLPVAVGTIVASIPANLLGVWSLRTSIVFALCNAGQVLLMSVLIERYFGSAFSLGSLRQVLGLVAAAIVGTAAAAIGGTVGVVLVEGSTAPALTIWYHWLTSNVPGIVAVAPLLIGFVSAVRDPPPRSEIIEGVVVLAALTALSGLIIFLPREPWVIGLLFPLLLWLAARCRPVFAAAAAFITALTIVWTTTFSIGMFGQENLPMAERVLAAQAAILAVSLCAIVLASLFSERRESEARLARSNMMLQRERNNKLMNIDAITSAIVHEVRQPLAAIATNGSAGIRWLTKTPPDFDEVRAAMTRIVRDSHRASQVLESIRALFKSADLEVQPVDLNGIALGALDLLRGELTDHGVITRTELAPELPLVGGHSGQLQEVMLNLVRNAIDAMDSITDRARVLRDECDGREAIVVSVEDSGPGIDPKKVDSIFDAFVTTKPHGMGLGLAICRMIILRHEGQLSASAENKSGALFQFTLPIKSAVGDSTASL